MNSKYRFLTTASIPMRNNAGLVLTRAVPARVRHVVSVALRETANPRELTIFIKIACCNHPLCQDLKVFQLLYGSGAVFR
jgi:hypothetical protein